MSIVLITGMFLAMLSNLPEWALVAIAACPVFYLVFRDSENSMLYDLAQALGRFWLCGVLLFFVFWLFVVALI